MPKDTRMKLPKVPSFVKNVVKSVGYAAENKFKHIAPNMTELASTNSELTRDLYGKVRDYKSTIKNVGRLVAGSEVYKGSNNLLKNAMDDLKTGNFYNKARENAIMDEVFGGGDDNLFNIEDGFDNALNFDDSDGSSSDDMAGFEAVARTSVRNADHVADTIRKTTGASVSTLVQNQREIANHQMILSTENFNATMHKLGNLDQSIVNSANMIADQLQNLITPNLQYYNDSMGKLTEISGYMKEMTEMKRNMYQARNKEIEGAKFKEDPYENMIGGNGSLDMTQYAKAVLGNMGKEFDSSTMGMFDMFGGPSGFMKMMSASPLSFMPNMLVAMATPVVFTKAIDRLDKSIGGFFTSLIAKFTGWQESESPLRRMIGRIFGLKMKNSEAFNLGDYNVELGGLDKMTHRTINTVIPTYLRQIVGLLGGEESTFDHKSGTFQNMQQLKKSYNDTLESVTMDGISEYTEKINERIDMLLESVTDLNEVNKVKDDSKAILKKMVNSGGLYTKFKEKNLEDFESTLGSINLKGGDESFKIFSTIFDSLDKDDQLNFSNAINDSRINKRKLQQSIINDMYARGYDSLFNGSHQGMSMQADEKGNFTLAPMVEGSFDKFNKTTNEYLRDIKGILLRGIKVYTAGVFNGNPSDALAGIESDLKQHNSEKTLAREIRDAKNKKETKSQEQRDKDIARKIAAGEIDASSLKSSIDEVDTSEETKEKIRKRVEKQREDEAKSDEENSFMYQMFGDTLIYTQIKDSKKWLQGVVDKPFSLLTKIADRASDFLHEMVFGKTTDKDSEKKGLFKTIKDKFDSMYRDAMGWLNEKIFTPIKDFFKGNDSKEGLFSKINRFMFNPMTSAVAGYMGLDTNKYDVNDPKSMEAMRTDMKSKFKDWATKMGMADMLKSAGIGGAAGLLMGSPLMGAMMGGAFGILKKSEGFQKLVFGELDENNERTGGIISKQFAEDFKKKMPGMGIGAGIGALLSTGVASFIPGLGLLGSLFTPFGMIGGALTGMGLSIAAQSDKFKTWLMGDLNEDGERQGGVLSKSLSNNLGKTLLKSGVGGATGGFLGGKLGALIGAGMSFIPGLGLLGSVMGPAGAIGGTILGMGFGIASSTDKFKTMLFGEADEKTGERNGGLFNKKFREKFKSILPKAGLGAIAGGLTFGKLFSLLGAGAAALVPGFGGILGSVMGPAGVIGGSLMGLGLAISSSSDTFKEKMFGKDDGKEKPSVVDNMSSWIEEKVLSPLKGWFDKTALNVAGFFKDSIQVPFETALIPLKKEFQLMTESMKDMFKSAWDTTQKAIGNIFEQHVGKPFGEVMEEKVLKPLKSWIGKIVGGIGKMFGSIIASPIKLLTAVAQSTYRKHTREGEMDYGNEMGDQRGQYEKKVTFGDRISGLFNKFFKTHSFKQTKEYGKDQVKGAKAGLGQMFKDKTAGIRGTFDKMNGAYNKAKDELGDSMTAATVSTFGMLNSAIEKLGNYLFGAAEANRENIDAQQEFTETMQDVAADMVNPGSSLNDIVDSDKKRRRARGQKVKGVRRNTNNANSQATPKESEESSESKESDRYQSKVSKVSGLKFDSFKGVPTSVLQRTSAGVIVDTLPEISKNIKNINKNVDGQLDGIGDNINRIRLMLGDVLGDKDGKAYDGKKRTSFFGRLLDMVLSPVKFATEMVTKLITAPFKLLSATVSGLASVTKAAITGVTSTAAAMIKAIGSTLSIGVNLLTGVARGLGNILSGVGSVIGNTFKFLGETALATGTLIRDGLFGSIKLAGQAIGAFGKAMISMTGTLLDVTAFLGKSLWSMTKGLAKAGYDVVKGTIGFGLDTVSGLLGRVTGTKKTEMFITGGKLDTIVQGPDIIPALEPLLVSISPTKAALRVFVENYAQEEKAKKAEEAVNTLKGEDKEGDTPPKDGKEPNKKKPNIFQRMRAGFASIFKPKGVTESSSVSDLVTGGPLLLGYNGKSGDGESTPTQTAENRLALADNAKMKQATKDTAENIQNMSSAVVTAQDEKLNALRVRIVKSKEEEEGGVFGMLKKFLPGISVALLGLPALIAGIKNLFIDRNGPNSKDRMTTTQEITRFGLSTAFKLPSVKMLTNATADYLNMAIDHPGYVANKIKNSKVGKMVGGAVDAIKGTRAGQAVGNTIKNATSKVTAGASKVMGDLIDLTNMKNSMMALSDIMVDMFFGMADKLDDMPLFKGTFAKLAGVLRKTAVKFAELVLKGPEFMKIVMANFAKKGVTSIGKASVVLFRSMAKSFFPVVSFLEGFTQAQTWNGTATATLTEKMIGGVTFALLDILQALATAATGLSGGATLIINVLLLALQQTMPYWNDDWTEILLKGIDMAFGTDKAEDYLARQKEVDNEYKISRGKEYKDKLQAEYDKRKADGYEGDITQFEAEHSQEIVDTLTSKADFIRKNYNQKEFSLMSPSTWMPGMKSVMGDLTGGVVDGVVGGAKNLASAGMEKVNSGLSSIAKGFVTGLDNVTNTFKGWYDTGMKATKDFFIEAKNSLVDSFKPVLKFKDTMVEAFKGTIQVMAEHPLSPFKKLIDVFEKVKDFFYGGNDNMTFIDTLKDGMINLLPDWMKPKTSGKGADEGGNFTKNNTPQPTGVRQAPEATKQPSAIQYAKFSQNDSKWANLDFETGGVMEKFSKGGCAPTVMAMLLNSLAGKNTDPGQLANEALRFASNEGGVKLDYFKKVGAMNGLSMGDLLAFGGDVTLDENLNPKGKLTDSLLGNYTKTAIEHLRSGKPLVGLVDDGKSRHYVLATGMAANGDIKLIDPSDGREYTQPAAKFFKAVKYGYAVQPSEVNNNPNGIMQNMKTEGLSMGSAFFNAVKNLITKGIFSYDDLDAKTVKDEAHEVFGDVTGVKGVTGLNSTFTPNVTREQMISEVKGMMSRNKVEGNVTQNVVLGAEPTELGPYKIGDETIIENGQIVQFPRASVIGATKGGRPVFYAGSPRKNELGLRMNYGTGVNGFIKTMEPFAKYAYDKANLRPGIALAQTGHETAWGQNIKGNIAFNMKYANQANATPLIYTTGEGKDGKEYRVAAFANFPGMADSWMAHYNLMANSKYYKGYLQNQWTNPDLAIESLQKFAEDAGYVDKMKRVFHKQGSKFENQLGITGPKSSTIPDELKPAEGDMADKLSGKGLGRFGNFNFTPSRIGKSQIESALKQFTDTSVRSGAQTIADRGAGVKNNSFFGNLFGAAKNLGSSLLSSAGLGFIPGIIGNATNNFKAVQGGQKSFFGGIFDTLMGAGDAIGLSPITSLIRNFIGTSNRVSTTANPLNDPMSLLYGGLSSMRGDLSGMINPKYSQLADLGMNSLDRFMNNRKQNSIVVNAAKFDEAQLGKMTLEAKRRAIGNMMQSKAITSDPGIADTLTSAIGNIDTMKESQADSMLKILGQLLESNQKTNEVIQSMIKNQLANTGGNNTVIMQGGRQGGSGYMPNPNVMESADDAFALLEKIKGISGQRF